MRDALDIIILPVLIVLLLMLGLVIRHSTRSN